MVLYNGFLWSLMKDVMANESSSNVQGVPSFEYSPASKRQPFLFELSRPLKELGDSILIEFAGQTLSMYDVYYKHNVGRQYIKRNYKSVLRKLESEGAIIAKPPFKKRPKDTFADRVQIIFPIHGD